MNTDIEWSAQILFVASCILTLYWGVASVTTTIALVSWSMKTNNTRSHNSSSLMRLAATILDSDILSTITSFVIAGCLRGKLSTAKSLSNRETAAQPDRASWSRLQQLTAVTVPHAWFSHFYVMGIVMTTFVILVLWHVFPFNTDVELTSFGTLLFFLPSLLFLVQVIRRYLECCYLFKSSTQATVTSRMSVVGYVAGLSYYFLTPLTITFDRIYILREGTVVHNNVKGKLSQVMAVIGVTVFIYGSIIQFQCHKHLSSLREKASMDKEKSNVKGTKGADPSYQIPTAGWFRWITCPHYTAEIILYIGILIVTISSSSMSADSDPHAELALPKQIKQLQHPNVTLLLLMVFVTSNLCLAGGMTRDWYHKTFGKAYDMSPKADGFTRSRIIGAVIPYAW